MKETNADTLVIGAGPAGLMAALEASQRGDVIIIEKEDSPGKKLLLTGGGRCNVSNRSSLDDYLEHIPRGANFLRSAFSQFFHEDLVCLFGKELPLITEDDRLYPRSQKAHDVLEFFLRKLSNTEISTDTKVTSLQKVADRWIIKSTRGTFSAKKVIVSSGGRSLPHTGSDGSMFRILSNLGVEITPINPALVSMFMEKPWKELAGLTCPDVVINSQNTSLRGSLLFTHKGVSGPVVLDMSSLVERFFPMSLTIDFVPDKAEKDVMEYLFSSKQSLASRARAFVPERLARHLFPQTNDKHQWNKERRQSAARKLKALEVSIRSFAGFESAIVTRGGIALPQLDPSTLEHKTLKGLYFAGECLDVDALSGGYNLQIAWSTGFLSGQLK